MTVINMLLVAQTALLVAMAGTILYRFVSHPPKWRERSSEAYQRAATH